MFHCQKGFNHTTHLAANLFNGTNLQSNEAEASSMEHQPAKFKRSQFMAMSQEPESWYIWKQCCDSSNEEIILLFSVQQSSRPCIFMLSGTCVNAIAFLSWALCSVLLMQIGVEVLTRVQYVFGYCERGSIIAIIVWSLYVRLASFAALCHCRQIIYR